MSSTSSLAVLLITARATTAPPSDFGRKGNIFRGMANLDEFGIFPLLDYIISENDRGITDRNSPVSE